MLSRSFNRFRPCDPCAIIVFGMSVFVGNAFLLAAQEPVGQQSTHELGGMAGMSAHMYMT